MKLAVWMVLFLATQVAQATCHITAGVGQSTIEMFGPGEVEEDLFETDYSSSASTEDQKSTTGEFSLGCAVNDWMLVELGAFDGFKHTVGTEVTLAYEEYSADFDVHRVIGVRGYALSLIGEFPIGDRKYLFGRAGAAYVMLEGDVFAPSFPYSVHATKSDIVPVIGVGGRYEIDNQWSVLLEYRAVGHYDVTHTGVSFRYTF
jgi:hypothetical protein